MRILLIADGRSPTALRWLRRLVERGYQVFLVSSYPCPPPDMGLAGFQILPLAFSNYLRGGSIGNENQPDQIRRFIRRFRNPFLNLRYWLGPLTTERKSRAYLRIVQSIQPDLVHAMRIPYEGMLASWTPDGIPLVVSTWGNDLTLHARGSRWMDSATRQTLHRTDGLVSDTQRDLKLAQEWGFDPQKPALEVPGSGGVNLEEVRAAKSAATPLPSEWLDGRPIIVNPRGIRPGSVRTDTFFKAIPHVLERIPRAAFACPSMAGQPEAIQWVTRLGLQEQVCLLPLIPQSQLWRLYDDSQVLVSVSEHDGTPNSVLEGMACGCFPVAGDIDSMREWIEPGVNGLLVPPGDETALAQAIYTAIEDSKLRSQAAERNLQLVTTRAETTQVMLQVEHFYQTVLNLPR